MYLPLAEAMNYALEQLSHIDIDGLPRFKTHIAFVPCNRRVLSDRDIEGSSFKPDIAIMSIGDAYEFHELNGPDPPPLSEFINTIQGRSPSGVVKWKTVLSAIEIKRKKARDWPPLIGSDPNDGVTRDVNKPLDEVPDDSQPSTCKINGVSSGYILTRVVQRHLPRPLLLINDPRAPRGWMPVSQVPSDSARARSPRWSRKPWPIKVAYTRRRNSPIHFLSAMCLIYLLKVSMRQIDTAPLIDTFPRRSLLGLLDR